MIRQPISVPVKLLLGFTSIGLLVGFYAWLSHRQHQINPNDTTIPNYEQFVEGWKLITSRDRSGEIWLLADAQASLERLALGFAAGVALSFVVGLAMGCFAPVEAFCLPPISFLAKIPPTAMLAVYFVLVGTDLKLFVAMIALGIFPTLAQAICQAAKKDVTEHTVSKAYTLGASHLEVIWDVVYKQILPRIIENVRLQVGPAVVFLIAVEWLVNEPGFGYRLRIQSRVLNMNVVYIYLIILGLFGFLVDSALSFLRRRICPWFGE
jgi:NitT/TauT family transport system permease protein